MYFQEVVNLQNKMKVGNLVKKKIYKWNKLIVDQKNIF